MSQETAILTARLLDGRMSPESRRYNPHILDLSSNENPFGAGALARAAIVAELDRLHRYPLVSSPLLRHALASHHGVAESEIVIGSGATGLLGVIAHLVLASGDKAAFSRSSLFAYRQSVLSARGQPVEVPLTSEFHHDLDALALAAQSGTKLLLISNPHNPTGIVFDHAEFERFLEKVPDNVLVVLDEAYPEFSEDISLLPQSVMLTRKHSNVLSIRTFSKVHGLAGARVGYAIGQARAIAAIEAFSIAVNPGGVGTLAEVAAEAALRDREHVERSVRHVAAERIRAYRLLDDLRLPYLRSHANFIMARAGADTARLVSFLRHQDVLITSGEYFGYPDWFRFSLQTCADTDRFFGLLQVFQADQCSSVRS